MLDIKELFVKILQKFNKSLIVTQSYMTEAKDVSAAGYAILEATYTTKDGYNACMAHVIDTTNVRLLPRSCYFTNNSKVRVYVYNPTSATITNGQVRVEVIYCLRGGIKDSFSYLSRLLKSFAGRRWAYAEHQEIADEAVRESRCNWYGVLSTVGSDIEQCELNAAYRSHNSSCRDIYFTGDFSARINSDFCYLPCRKILNGIWYGWLFCDDSHDNWNVHTRKKRTVRESNLFIHRAWLPDSNSHCITSAPERGWLCA